MGLMDKAFEQSQIVIEITCIGCAQARAKTTDQHRLPIGKDGDASQVMRKFNQLCKVGFAQIVVHGSLDHERAFR